METLAWLHSLSLEKSNTAADGSTIDETKSGSGHSYEDVNGSMGALVMLALFVLVMSTFYLVYRVYKKQKYLSESWIKEYGQKPAPSAPAVRDSISRDIPREIDESVVGKGAVTEAYGANVNSKRELVPQTENKLNMNNELAISAKSQ